MEQIRIIKEMREEDQRSGRTGKEIRPRYMVWENVPGAFSSNKGKDFAAVIEEAIKIVEPEAPSVEVPAKGWPTWGGYHDGVAGRWSLAWRVLDAQYWGVPQRRRRIALVVDFGGDTAGEILFERKSVFRDTESGRTEREETSTGVTDCTGDPSNDYINRIRILDMAHPCDVIRDYGSTVPTLQHRMGTGGNNIPLVFDGNSIRKLTHLECERSQGFPDNWTNIGDYIDSNGRKRKTSDSARYKALGNSIAIPPWTWVLNRICENYDRPATLASLFDGIGGFPLIWERINGKGTCFWAAEIEEFPIAVTKVHFNNGSE